jgi:hypothetical protein
MTHKALKFFNVAVFIALSHSTASHGAGLRHSFWEVAARAAGVSATDLYGIALQETGMRWDDGTFRPWPWTLVVNGPSTQTFRYANQEETVSALNRLVSHGITNVDVGLMQVNLKYNGKAYVKSPADLVEPRTNLIVATHVLKATLKAANTKRQGIGRYHSRTPWRSERYADRINHYSQKLAYVYQR